MVHGCAPCEENYMSFEFSNNTYSGLISIFSMIVGMAYPAVQSAIREIDAKYESGQIIEYFMTESSYRWFRFCLALAILFALCCPFVLICSEKDWFHYTCTFLHTIVVLAMLASAIKLYTVIMVYYRSGELVEHVKARAQSENTKVASVYADIANFAALRGQKKIYMAAEQAIADQLISELRLQKYCIQPVAYDINNPSTFNSSLSEDLNRAIERMMGIQTRRDYSTFFTSDTTLVSVFYNIIEQHTMSEGLRDMIWHMVNEISLSGNKEWVMLYWSIADQYARSLKYNRSPKNKNEIEQLREEVMTFKEFHAAIGGMLIKYGKTKWLKYILFFTNKQPASYPLLSNTFADVMGMLERFESKLRRPYLWTIQKHYQMQGIQNGVNTDESIVRYIEMFIAIEFLRLWHIDYNGEYRDPLGKLVVSEKMEDNQHSLDLLERLQWCVNEVFDKNLNNVLNFRQPTKTVAVDYIKENMQIFKEKLQRIDDNPEIDEEKRTQIINSIEEASKKWKESGNDVQNSRFTETQQFSKTMPHRFPKEFLLKNYATSYPSLGFDVIEGLKANFKSVLPSFLMLCKPAAAYQISYEHVGDALRRLNLSNEYVVLALGFDSSSYFRINGTTLPEATCKDGVWYFNGAQFHEMWGRGDSSLVIIRKEDVPMADLVKSDAEQASDLISTSMPIYSNLRKVNEKNYMNVYYRIYVDVHYPKDMRFVRIDIPNVFTSNRYDLDKVKSIDELIKQSEAE